MSFMLVLILSDLYNTFLRNHRHRAIMYRIIQIFPLQLPNLLKKS